MEMITIPMTASGPDMDLIEELVKDPARQGYVVRTEVLQPGGHYL